MAKIFLYVPCITIMFLCAMLVFICLFFVVIGKLFEWIRQKIMKFANMVMVKYDRIVSNG